VREKYWVVQTMEHVAKYLPAGDGAMTAGKFDRALMLRKWFSLKGRD
jgi:hypothetical protein